MLVPDKTTAYRKINSFLENRVGLRPVEIGQTGKKLTPLKKRFIYVTSCGGDCQATVSGTRGNAETVSDARRGLSKY